jgi:hypothetical protein
MRAWQRVKKKNVFAGGPTAHFLQGGASLYTPETRRPSAEIGRRGLPTSSSRSGLECPAAALVDNLFHWRRAKRKEVSAVDEHRLMREY